MSAKMKAKMVQRLGGASCAVLAVLFIVTLSQCIEQRRYPTFLSGGDTGPGGLEMDATAGMADGSYGSDACDEDCRGAPDVDQSIDAASTDDRAIAVDAGQPDAGYEDVSVVTCHPEEMETDRESELVIGFMNTLDETVYLVTAGGQVMFFTGAGFYFFRAYCECNVSSTKPEMCGSCDLPPFFGWGVSALDPSQQILYSNGSYWTPNGYVKDGYHNFLCEQKCTLTGAEDVFPCQRRVPLPSGDYEVAFCASRRETEVPHDFVFAEDRPIEQAFCPDGYTKLVKTVHVGQADTSVVVYVEESDLQR